MKAIFVSLHGELNSEKNFEHLGTPELFHSIMRFMSYQIRLSPLSLR
jgi:hypothetical protein